MSDFQNQPGVVLSFDDFFNIQDWVKAMDMFNEFDAKATFFIHAPDEMSIKDWSGLERLATNGHAIGCHGLRHERAVDYCDKYGSNAWLEKEVFPSLNILKQKSFNVTSFAYPCSQRNDSTDALLKPYFRHVRTGVGIEQGQRFSELDNIFKKPDSIVDNFLLPAKGIDWLEEISQIKAAAQRAADNDEIVFLLGHRIGKSLGTEHDRHYIDVDLLADAIKFIANIKLKFYTFDDLE